MLLAVWMMGCGTTDSAERKLKLAETHYLMGADYLKKKKPFAAKRELLRSIELNPNNPDAHNLLGVFYFMDGIHKANLVDITQCLEGEEADEQRSVVNEAFRNAERHFKESVRLTSEENRIESTTRIYLANIALHFKRYDEAVTHSKRALDNSFYVSRYLAHGIMGWAYFQKGDLRQAGRELRQAVFQEPKFCLGRYRLAKVYFAQKNYDRVIKELSQVAGDKACPIQEAPYLMGLAYSRQRKLDSAREKFEACVKLNQKSCLARVCGRLAKGAARTPPGTED